MADFHVFEDSSAVAEAAAQLYIALSHRALDRRGRFTVALPGGSTPAPLFQVLATSPWREAIPWDRTLFFWGDDRVAEPDNEHANYHMARLILLDKVPVREENVIRIRGELGAESAAEQLRCDLQEGFGTRRVPRFDLVLLGVGEDGHTASLFPGSNALDSERWAEPVFEPDADPPLDRVTMTLPVLNNARTVLFLALGKAKAPIISRMVNDPEADTLYPAARVEARETLWYVDEAAFSAVQDG